jgi:glucose-1-phosphate thymidylyltransferase
MKGIILAGGTGSRVYPSTTTVSKQLLPVYDKPTIYYPLTTLIKLGIKDIMIITNGLSYPNLLTLFKQADGKGKPYLGLNFTFKVQIQPKGIAEALIIAEEWQGAEDVCLILGDNIFTGIQPFEWSKDCGAHVVGYKVANPSDYGVIETRQVGSKKMVKSIEEKPDCPMSNIAATGIYFYDETAGERARNLMPSDRGELEITDLNKSYLKEDLLCYSELDSHFAWFDTGNPDEMFAASMYVKSIQDRTQTMIGCIEGEAYRKGFIGRDELSKIKDKMPSCQYKTNLTMSYLI